MNSGPQRIVTGDGSHSLYLPEMRETYHSTHGAVRESMHVFIKNGLEAAAAETKGPLHIFEVGFGTGLNVLLSAVWAELNGRMVHMTSIEAYPIGKEIWSGLNYAQQVNKAGAESWWNAVHEADWNAQTNIHNQFTINKIHGKLEDYQVPENEFDIVYYDAFAPGKQAEMWTITIVEKAVSGLKKNGCLVTYCAQGQFKRDLKTLGLQVESLAGPPGKKEMTRGRKVNA